jgi:hypothetical protein
MLNSSEPLFNPAGECVSPATAAALAAMTQQILDFAWQRQATPPNMAQQRLEA